MIYSKIKKIKAMKKKVNIEAMKKNFQMKLDANAAVKW
jgi:hypothetical protein